MTLEELRQRNAERLRLMALRGQHFHPVTLPSMALDLLVDVLVESGLLDREAFEHAYEQRLSDLLDRADSEHVKHVLLREP